jgi:hypothetical protein
MVSPMIDPNIARATEHATHWAEAAGEKYGIEPFAPEGVWGGRGLYEGKIKFRIPDDLSDDQARQLVARVVGVLTTTTPGEWSDDGLQTLRVVATPGDVGGRPGVVARLDIQFH